MGWRFERQRLELIHPFTVARGTSYYRETLRLELEHQGVVGFGEAAPNPRYGESLDSAAAAFGQLPSEVAGWRPGSFRNFIASSRSWLGNQYAARAAVDMAVLDWVGKAHGEPVYRLLGIDPERMPATSFTVGIDTPGAMAGRAGELSRHYRVLKIKLGTDRDRDLIRAIRQVTPIPLRIDANEGWKSPEAALGEIEWLAERDVEFIEQPLPSSMDDRMPWLKERSPLPLIADESVCLAKDLERVSAGFHGINVKLMKCGGILNALELIALAREWNLSVMIGCMVESSCGLAAAAQVAPLADFADLDSNLYLANDPFSGHPITDGRIVLSAAPGLGVHPA